MTNCFTLQRFYDNDMKVFKYQQDEWEAGKNLTQIFILSFKWRTGSFESDQSEHIITLTGATLPIIGRTNRKY